MRPSARPRSPSGKANATIAIVVGIMSAAPTPWETARSATSRKTHCRREAGEGRRHAEQDRPGQEDLPQPELVADPAAEHHQRRQRQHVGGEDPLPALQRRAEAGDRVRSGERHRGLVDEDHAVGDRHRHQREPLCPATSTRILAYRTDRPGPRLTSDHVKVRALRGAITCDENTKQEIEEKTQRLVEEMLARNELEHDDLVSVIFTATDDLTAEFPAAAARGVGLGDIPLLCARELAIDGGKPMCIRILVHCYTERTRDELHHVYLERAGSLRDDLPE